MELEKDERIEVVKAKDKISFLTGRTGKVCRTHSPMCSRTRLLRLRASSHRVADASPIIYGADIMERRALQASRVFQRKGEIGGWFSRMVRTLAACRR